MVITTYDPLTKILLRLQAGRTQVALAKELGVDQSLLSYFYRGAKRPGLYMARCIVRRYPDLKEEVKEALLNVDSLELDEGPPAA